MDIKATVTVPAHELRVPVSRYHPEVGEPEVTYVDHAVDAKTGEAEAWISGSDLDSRELMELLLPVIEKAYAMGHEKGRKHGADQAAYACRRAAERAGVQLKTEFDR